MGGSIKSRLVIPLHKKGSLNDCNNYRGAVLLAMDSTIVTRCLADRIRIWSEEQAGFRKKRSTADVTQIMYRIQEDVIDLKKRKAAEGVEEVDDEKFAGRLLDLKKAYPRVNKYEMLKILEYWMGEKCLRTVKNLHETTEYNIKSREAKSEA
jgi:hypothetical protein